ncbi:MAG: hypothetical protein AB7V44_22900 [Pseudonocardia sp.]
MVGHRFGFWLACACGQSIADHCDPAGPEGFFEDGSCAFEFRACAFCPADQERHVGDVATVPDLAASAAGIDMEHRHGGFLGQDDPAGPVLPIHDTTGEHVSSEETSMVEPPTPPMGTAGGAR